jgi:hypothetical protein
MADVEEPSKAGTQNGRAITVPFENILNFRDVGKTINEFLGQKSVPLLALY